MNLIELIEFIGKSSQHRYLYHFTDEANFPSIDEKGLVSKERMRSEGWWPHTTGGNKLSHDLDSRYGLDQYVSLCLTRNHPMKYLAEKDGRLPNSRYLAIDPNVLQIEGTILTLGVANASSVERLPITQAIEKLDIEVLYQRTDWSDPQVQQRLRTAEKFEVLVPNNVPRDLIVGIM